MINLFTAVPGAGKTQYVVEKLLNLRLDEEKNGTEKRVIFTNIAELDPSLGCCAMLDFTDWRMAPDGTLFVIDEAQYVFPTRNSSQKAPEWIESLSTHRHRGYDFWIISQNPKLIDPHVRSLVDGHWHGYRPFGAPHTIWNFYNECCDNPASRVKPLKEKRKFNPEIFKFYKSTTIDTYKSRWPWKLFLKYGVMIFVAVSMLGGSIFYMRSLSTGDMLNDNKPSKTVPETAVSQSSTVATTTAVAPVKPEPKQLKYLGFSGFQSSDPNQKIVSFLLCEPMSGSSSVGQFSVPQSSSGDCQIRKLNDFSKWRIDGSRVLLFLLDDDENPQFFVSNPKILRDLDRMQMLP
nr:zonular occludens toxin domain-containing protein [uncultured Tolumonas sp.]